MKAVVLAAGEGSRLQPLTSSRPKHMITLVGKPILEHILLALRVGGIEDVIIVTGYREFQIRNYFGDGSQWGLNIDYVHQDTYLGSGHAIGLSESFFEEDFFLALYGDLLIHPLTINSVLRMHVGEGLPIICVVPVNNPESFGIARLNKGRVMEIIEKPRSKAFGNLANAGIYVFPREVFDEIDSTHKSERGEIEITDTINIMIRKGLEFAWKKVRFEDWMDIGRPWDLLEACERLLKTCDQGIEGEVEEGASLKGAVHVEEGSRIRSGSYLEGPIFIGRGCDIGPNCHLRPFTSLGRGVRVGNGCEVKNSLILEETHIGHLSYVGDSVVGANCNLGAGTITANLRLDGGNIKLRVKGEPMDSGRRKLGMIMGDDVETGIGTCIMPGVKIGGHSWIGPNTTIYKDVPPNTFITNSNILKNRTQRVV